MPETNNQRKSDFISKSIRLLTGSFEEFSLEHRIFNAAALFIFLSGIITFIFNVTNQYQIQGNITVGVMVAVFFILYLLSRFRKVYSGLIFFSITLVGTSFLWLFNDGINGSIPALFIMCSMLCIGVSKAKWHVPIILLTIAVFCFLVLFEDAFFQKFLVKYPSEELRRSDLIFAYIMSILVAGVFTNRLKMNFKRENRVIKEQRKELTELNSVKDKLFSIIGHDLTNQFNGILGFSEILKNIHEDTSHKKIRKYAEQVHESSENAYKILQELLDWASLQDNSVTFNPSNVNIRMIFNDLIRAFGVSAKNKHITFTANSSENTFVNADYNMLKTVLRNLVSNAIKFTEPGGRVSILAEKDSNNITKISVKDTGIGMKSSMVNNLFDIDVNTKREGTFGEPTTGLGLILCQGFLEKHNSRLKVESKPGKGSTFSFVLTC